MPGRWDQRRLSCAIAERVLATAEAPGGWVQRWLHHHFARCFRCRSYEYQLDRLDATLADQVAAFEPRGELRARVLFAYHQSFSNDGLNEPAAGPPRLRRLVLATGSVAVLVLLAGLVASRWPDFGPPPRVVVIELPANAELNAPVVLRVRRASGAEETR